MGRFSVSLLQNRCQVGKITEHIPFNWKIRMSSKIREVIAEFRETDDVEHPEDLVIESNLGDEEWSDVAQWQSTRRNCAIAKAAICVDETHRRAEVDV